MYLSLESAFTVWYWRVYVVPVFLKAALSDVYLAITVCFCYLKFCSFLPMSCGCVLHSHCNIDHDMRFTMFVIGISQGRWDAM